MQALQGAALVGRDVLSPGNRMVDHRRRRARAASSSTSPADRVKVEVLDAAGHVIDTVDLGAAGERPPRLRLDAAGRRRCRRRRPRFRITATERHHRRGDHAR